MGGSSSKAARKLPKAPPKWAGARTPNPEFPGSGAPSNFGRPPLASESKTEAVLQDAKDPHFLANLSKLGQVQVDHHMQTIRTAANDTHKLFRSRAQSDLEAFGTTPVRNRLHAPTLSDLLDARKSVKTQQELEKLANEHNIDVQKLESLARFVNSPSVQGGTAVRTVAKDGEESLTTLAVWAEPRIARAAIGS
ncbi:hypothetical protein AX16_010479 [Volvariella volvacea WC 439]|nr:hypothetical protein AX16_010479 [Volvariella volvacea WC 439]